MKQAEMIHEYNRINRPKFNPLITRRSEDDIINALKDVILSVQRESTFTIRVLGFEIIDNYDDINHILWSYEDNIINKNSQKDQPQSKPLKKISQSNTKVINQYEYINLKGTDLKILKVTYFISIVEKKNGLVNDTVTVYIAVPRVVNKYYFRINGKLYSSMYQITDASTYNNSASKNSKKQSVTLKAFMPIRVYRYNGVLKDIDGFNIPCTYFLGFIFTKSSLIMKYIFAKMGFYGTLTFFKVPSILVLDSIENIDKDKNYIFPIRDGINIVIDRFIYDSSQVAQSLVYTIHSVINYMKSESYNNIFNSEMWIKALGCEFTTKDINSIYNKGLSILGSLEFIYDIATQKDLKLQPEDKADIYRVIRWIINEFNALRAKDNLDISTKKVSYAKYIAGLYATRLANGIYRLSDKADKADLSTIKKAILIPPMFLINAITNCQLINYKDSVNDLDSLNALKYTYKGSSGIGEKSNAISNAYRSIHPSHLGRVDIDSSSNSDPGVSGTLCPLSTFNEDGHFMDFEEPSDWESRVNKMIDEYRSMNGRIVMAKIINEVKPSNNRANTQFMQECVEVCKSLLNMPLKAMEEEEYINGIDIFGDGLMFYSEE